MIQQLYEIFRRNRKKLLSNIENNQNQQCSHGLIVMTQKQFNKFWLYQLTRGISFTILLLACSFILTLIRCILLPWTWSKRTNSWARWDLPLFLHLWRKKCFGGTTFTVSPWLNCRPSSWPWPPRSGHKGKGHSWEDALSVTEAVRPQTPPVIIKSQIKTQEDGEEISTSSVVSKFVSDDFGACNLGQEDVRKEMEQLVLDKKEETSLEEDSADLEKEIQ